MRATGQTIKLGAFGELDRDRDGYDGRWPAYADGGYPFTYYTVDGGQLCPACANGDNDSDASVDNDDPQWKLFGADIFYEGPAYNCDHCGQAQESAYGDPNAEEKE